MKEQKTQQKTRGIDGPADAAGAEFEEALSEDPHRRDVPAEAFGRIGSSHRHTRLHGAVWTAVGAATLAVHHDAGPRVLILIVTSMILGGAATCCMGYLLAEQTLVYDSSEIGVLQSGFNDMAAEIAERELLRDLFGRHVGHDVAKHALRNGTAFTGNVCQAGVVFVDLAGYTALAADNPPDRVAAVLNAFFHIVVDVIDNHGGYVNKFEGDAALAIFGAPLTLDNPAGKALTAARSLRDALKAHRDVPDFGIGVTHGRVFAGNIGAEGRYEYTVIGDPVNEAARLSDLAKNRAGRLLASAIAVSDGGPAEGAHWQVGGDVMLRGRRQATTLAEPAHLIH
jgi:class 3 adenylate cyclase